MREHPTHIVVFNEPAEENEQALRGMAMPQTLIETPLPTSGIHRLGWRWDSGAEGKYYTRLGAAAMDLAQEEVIELGAWETVAGVYPNEQREIPAPVGEEPEPGGIGREDDALMAYLRGMRDATDLALHYRATGKALHRPPECPPCDEEPPPITELAWHLNNIGMDDNYRLRGRHATIAVLDTGIDLTHPDLRDQVVEGETAVSFVRGQSVQDRHGHGTHCAGLANGPDDPAKGPRYGVAPASNLLIAKVLSNQGRGYDDSILDGMEWAVENGARILSMSLGSRRRKGQPYRRTYEQIARTLLEDENGAVVIAAAGNDSRRPRIVRPVGNPAACPSILAVAATDAKNEVAYFSSAEVDDIGTLDVSAPGVRIHSAYRGSSYRTMSGTSMATPIVAGVAALYLEQDPKLTPQELWETLIESVIDMEPKQDYGYGLIQVP